jgi:hypothetical protein
MFAEITSIEKGALKCITLYSAVLSGIAASGTYFTQPQPFCSPAARWRFSAFRR